MNKIEKIACLFSMTIVMLLISANSAHAYLDPGSGSYLFQIMIATFVGVGFTVKIYWRKIKEFFIRLFFKSK
ncbi:MAG: hypothetical protein WCX65_10645 [bacterium]